MLRRVPVKKLSTHRTSCPSAISLAHRCEPRKPAPPVTSTRLFIRLASHAGDFTPASPPATSVARKGHLAVKPRFSQMKPHANGRNRGTHARADQIDRWANSRKRLLLMHPQPGASISYRCVRLLNSSRPFLPAIAFIPGGAAIGRVGTRSKSKYSALDRAGVIWPVRRGEADGRPREMPAGLICRITHDGRGDHLVARPWAFWRLRLTA
jgi:hypothetical protein